jgi:hypothetical protein
MRDRKDPAAKAMAEERARTAKTTLFHPVYTWVPSIPMRWLRSRKMALAPRAAMVERTHS